MTTSTAAPFDRQYQTHLKHVLPEGFRRARNFGFLHPNSKRLIAQLQVVLKVMPASMLTWMMPRVPLLCTCCGAPADCAKATGAGAISSVQHRRDRGRGGVSESPGIATSAAGVPWMPRLNIGNRR